MTDHTYENESPHDYHTRHRDARFVGHEMRPYTSKEEVEQLAFEVLTDAANMNNGFPFRAETGRKMQELGHVAAALLAERDSFKAEAEGAHAIIAAERAKVIKLREENERLRDAGFAAGIEAAATLIEPSNPRSDWTQYAKDCHKHAKAIRALIPPTPTPAPVVPKVKPLVFNKRDDIKGLHDAQSVLGYYNIFEIDGQYHLEKPSVDLGDKPQICNSFAEADAAAQADHDARILSQFNMAPLTGLEIARALSELSRKAGPYRNTGFAMIDAFLRALVEQE
jgi:hypothetical protein